MGFLKKQGSKIANNKKQLCHTTSQTNIAPKSKHKGNLIYGGFLKCGFPQQPWENPTKNDHFGVWNGGVPPFKETPISECFTGCKSWWFRDCHELDLWSDDLTISEPWQVGEEDAGPCWKDWKSLLFLGEEYLGVSLNGGTPHFTPQVLIIFSRIFPWLFGTTSLGKPHVRTRLNSYDSYELLKGSFSEDEIDEANLIPL